MANTDLRIPAFLRAGSPLEQLQAARDELAALKPWAVFGSACFRMMIAGPDGVGDIDGAAAQNAALVTGLLLAVDVAEPCCEECSCATYGDFPRTCIRPGAWIRAELPEPILDAIGASHLPEPSAPPGQAARDELAALKPWAAFGAWALDAARTPEPGDLDGGTIQDAAECFGLLMRITVTEPCGDSCRCADYGDFPQECLRLATQPPGEISAAVAAIYAGPDVAPPGDGP